MFWTLLTSLAAAGTIYVDSQSPVLCKLDGQLVRKDPAVRIIIPDVVDGEYRVEITNLLGATIAFLDVDLEDNEDLFLQFQDGYLDVVVPDHEKKAIDQNGLQRIPETEFRDLMRKLVRGSLKAKLKQLDKRTLGWGLSMRQADEMLSSFHSRADRMTALELVAERILEPEKYPFLTHHFGVKSDRERLEQLFQTLIEAQYSPGGSP